MHGIVRWPAAGACHDILCMHACVYSDDLNLHRCYNITQSYIYAYIYI